MQRLPRAGHKPLLPSPAPIDRSGSRAPSSDADTAQLPCVLGTAERRGAEDRRLWQWHAGTSRCITWIASDLARFTQTLAPAEVTHPSRNEGCDGFLQTAGTGELLEQKRKQP